MIRFSLSLVYQTLVSTIMILKLLLNHIAIFVGDNDTQIRSIIGVAAVLLVAILVSFFLCIVYIKR